MLFILFQAQFLVAEYFLWWSVNVDSWRQMWKNSGLKYLVSNIWRTESVFWDMHANHALDVTLGFSNNFVSCGRKYYFHFFIKEKNHPLLFIIQAIHLNTIMCFRFSLSYSAPPPPSSPHSKESACWLWMQILVLDLEFSFQIFFFFLIEKCTKEPCLATTAFRKAFPKQMK